MTITDAVGEHILARVIQAESEFEAALAMAEDTAGSTGSVENAQQPTCTATRSPTSRPAGRPPGVPIGSEPLAPRLFVEVCRRGLHAAILAQEGLDRLGLRGDARLVDETQDLIQHLRAVHRPCCRHWGSRPWRLLHQVRHLVDRDESTRLAMLMIAYRWASWRKRLLNVGFLALGAVVSWLGLTGHYPGRNRTRSAHWCWRWASCC